MTKGSNLYSIGLYSLTDQPLKLVPPINPIGNSNRVLGHCNGLICLQHHFYIRVLFWNPASRKHFNLPVVESRHSRDPKYTFVFGFGYDSVSDDYKVVKVTYPIKVVESFQFFTDDDNYAIESETNVYNMRSNSWRIFEGTRPYLISRQWPAALACGALHWIRSKKSDSSTLDRGDEVLLAMKYTNLVWYNQEKRTYRVVDTSEIGLFCDDPVVYLESLVSLGEKSESDEEAERVRRRGFKPKLVL